MKSKSKLFNSTPYIMTIKMVSMNILTSALLDCTDNLPLLFVINLFNIVNDDSCLPTCCHTVNSINSVCFLS